MGDCTLTSSHYTNHFEKLVGDDYAYPFSNVAEILLADDLTLANLECSFSLHRLESDSEYAFCGDPNYVQALVLGGVEAVTLSNNHTRDFGDTGIRDTEAALEEYGVSGIPGNQGQCFELRHGNGDTLRLGAYVHPFNGSAKQMEDGCKQLRMKGRTSLWLHARRGRKNLRPHQAADGAGPCRRERRRGCGGGDPPSRFAAHRSLSGQRDPVQHRQFLFRRQPEPFGQGHGHRPAHRVRHRRGPFVGDVLYPCCISSVSNRNDYRPTPYPPDTAAYRRCFQKLDGTFRPPVPKPEAAETTPLPPEPTLDAEPLLPLPDGGRDL
mgnify:CR=1 FL=1